MSLKFAKLEGDRLNLNDNYISLWHGNAQGGGPATLGNEGAYFVGVHGSVFRPGDRVSSLGLIAVTR